MSVVSVNKNERKKRVDDYFKKNKISRYANFKMYFKSVFLIVFYFVIRFGAGNKKDIQDSKNLSKYLLQ